MPADEEIEKMDSAHQIGLAAARMMEKLEDEYPDGIKVGNAIVLVSIEAPLPLEDGETEEDREYIEIFDFYSTSANRATQFGIMELAKEQIIHEQRGIIDLTDDEDDPE